jgi:hypothetical protein
MVRHHEQPARRLERLHALQPVEHQQVFRARVDPSDADVAQEPAHQPLAPSGAIDPVAKAKREPLATRQEGQLLRGRRLHQGLCPTVQVIASVVVYAP